MLALIKDTVLQIHGAAEDIIKNYKYLKNTHFTYLGRSFIRDARLFFRDTELIPKTVRFILATGLLDQFATFTKTLSPLE